MARGLLRWSEGVGERETWFARIEQPDSSAADITKNEYDANGHEPPFWQLPRLHKSYSGIVAKGMERVCKDFSARVAPLGFKKTGRREWTRSGTQANETIYFHRAGSSYGAPRNASADIRVMLAVRQLNDDNSTAIGVDSDNIRKPDGHAYHHRFNAETWSTYDQCVDELALFVIEFAEPWLPPRRR
jgi:hypothetical protein